MALIYLGYLPVGGASLGLRAVDQVASRGSFLVAALGNGRATQRNGLQFHRRSGSLEAYASREGLLKSPEAATPNIPVLCSR